MSEFALRLLGGDALAALHDEALPQKDEFCGPFHGALALQSFGIESVGEEPVDQDLVAREALTTLSPAGSDPHESLPPGEQPRLDYRLALPRGQTSAGAGTNAPQLARAIERVGAGRLAVVPVAGPWSASSVEALLDTVHTTAPETVLIANVRTGRFWSSKPTLPLLFAVLAGDEVEGPPSEWDAGHFVSLAFLLRGPGGVLVGVRDTYRSLGLNGTHVQPAGAVAAALERGDGRGGGVLCVCRAQAAPRLRGQLEHAAFTLADWDNGSVPAPAAG